MVGRSRSASVASSAASAQTTSPAMGAPVESASRPRMRAPRGAVMSTSTMESAADNTSALLSQKPCSVGCHRVTRSSDHVGTARTRHVPAGSPSSVQRPSASVSVSSARRRMSKAWTSASSTGRPSASTTVPEREPANAAPWRSRAVLIWMRRGAVRHPRRCGRPQRVPRGHPAVRSLPSPRHAHAPLRSHRGPWGGRVRQGSR